MQGRLFTLVSEENAGGIFAWGIEITDRDEREAVIYRRDPNTGHATHGVHASADTALALCTRMARVPLVLVYMDYADEIERMAALRDAGT